MKCLPRRDLHRLIGDPTRDGDRRKGDELVCPHGYTVGMSKVMVSLPDELLVEIDAEVKRRATSRSALLARAARRELDRRDPSAIEDAIVRSNRRFAEGGSFEAADLVRRDRDSRR